MENKVGENIPSAQTVQHMVAKLEALIGEISAFAVSLSPEQRKGITKLRPGGERIVSLVGDLAKKYGVDSPETSVDAMRDDLTLAQRLAPLAHVATALANRLDDTILEAHGECWHSCTANYTLLAARSRDNADLANALKPAVDFFATGRRRKPSAGTP
jgi:hypothetical protein